MTVVTGRVVGWREGLAAARSARRVLSAPGTRTETKSLPTNKPGRPGRRSGRGGTADGDVVPLGGVVADPGKRPVPHREAAN